MMLSGSSCSYSGIVAVGSLYLRDLEVNEYEVGIKGCCRGENWRVSAGLVIVC